MQELVIRNVKTAIYESVNLNQHYDSNGEHKRAFEFQKSNVVSPYKNGEGKLTINFYTLQPGKSNYPYHQHFGREEAFYIISGTATLKTPKGDIEVAEGDVILYPESGNVRIMAGGMQKSFKMDSEVNYLDGE